ncbi:MAG TPA: cell wall-binding repeat-containing protein, partial [Acidothermaceae bacterium]
MRRLRQSGLIAVAALALMAPAAPALASSGGGTGLAPIGSAAAVPSSATALGAVPKDQTISFDVVLKPRNQAALDQLVHDVSTLGSPTYHQFLKTGEFDTRFGATPQATTAVADQMKQLGLNVDSVNGSIVHLSGSTTRVASALHTSFKQYRLESGRVARANVAAPELSTTVSPYVQGIVGLDTLIQAHHPAPTIRANVARAGLAHPNTAAPSACFLEQSSGYYSAGQIGRYYGLDSYWNAGNFGAGITIAMFELEDYDPADIDSYQQCYATNVSVTNVPVDGGAVANPSDPYPGLEAALDIEGAIGLAPGASIRVYEGPNSVDGILNTYKAIADANVEQVVSTSWGICELNASAVSPTGGLSPLTLAERQVFQQMAAQGQTVLAAAGDQGSADCDVDPPNTTSALTVDDPASQPEVTGVGGTDLTSSTGPETTWNDGLDASNAPVAGGGGISSLWTMPAWQTGEGVIASSSATPCGAPAGSYCREVPDVSASADPSDGYVVAYDVADHPNSLTVVGGTSAAAPMWASLVALIDSACTGNRLGLINPALYALHAADISAFNDVTVGDIDALGTNGGMYPAIAGYDMATGLGTPRGAAIGDALCSAVASDGAGTMTVSPTTIPPSSHVALAFTYQAPPGQGLADGTLTLDVPASWTDAPQTTNPTAAGYVAASAGVVSTAGSTITVSGVTTIAGGTVSILYGDKSQGGPGAVAPNGVDASQFAAQSAGESGGALTALASSPWVRVNVAADGSGTMTVSPMTLNASQSTTLAFTYQASAAGGLADGEVDVVVPSSWTQPIDSPGAAYVTATGGSGANTVTISGSGPWTIAVSGVSLSPGGTLRITYGDTASGGIQATAPVNGQPFVFTTSEKSFPGGTLKPLATSPTVQVNGPAADGSGTMTVTPSSVTTGSSQTLTFTYTPPAGGTVTGGAVSVAIPTTWSTPVPPTPGPGNVTVAGGAGANTVTIDTSGTPTIVVGDVTLAAGQELTIVYGDTTGGGAKATAPSSFETTTFTTQMANGGGIATTLATSPTVTVTAPPPPSGGGGGGGAFGHPDLTRVFGPDRIATSVAASQAAFPKANSARVAVLARSDSFADALAGTPLAAKEGGPLLLTLTSALPATTADELTRVLPGGSTVYLLGGASAISGGVQTQLTGMGYSVTRLAGADRYATAVAVAGSLGNPTTVFEADGTNFPDALSAGSAAAQQGAAVLLTAGPKQSPPTASYLQAHPSVRYAVGGPAAKADPGATPLVGADRYATSAAVAQKFFNAPLSVGLASGMNFPDALSGGAVTANHGGPILLVPNIGTIPASVTFYLGQTAALSAS